MRALIFLATAGCAAATTPEGTLLWSIADRWRSSGPDFFFFDSGFPVAGATIVAGSNVSINRLNAQTGRIEWSQASSYLQDGGGRGAPQFGALALHGSDIIVTENSHQGELPRAVSVHTQLDAD